jgi:hypothetical protein
MVINSDIGYRVVIASFESNCKKDRKCLQGVFKKPNEIHRIHNPTCYDKLLTKAIARFDPDLIIVSFLLYPGGLAGINEGTRIIRYCHNSFSDVPVVGYNDQFWIKSLSKIEKMALEAGAVAVIHHPDLLREYAEKIPTSSVEDFKIPIINRDSPSFLQAPNLGQELTAEDFLQYARKR